MTEAIFQKQCISKAKRRGWLAYKFASPSHRGVPDCIFIYKGRVIFIEFKNPNGRGMVSALQKRKIAELESHGADCFVVDNMGLFSEIIEFIESEAA
tara:strand:- start:10 stop:300 length:291 start_codon:yes stop_codon:yes gene_type:complete